MRSGGPKKTSHLFKFQHLKHFAGANPPWGDAGSPRNHCNILLQRSCIFHPTTPKEAPMKANVGNLDRALRAVIGIVLLVLYFNGTVMGTLGVVLAVVGLVLILSALLKWCPIYRVLGMSTCPRS